MWDKIPKNMNLLSVNSALTAFNFQLKIAVSPMTRAKRKPRGIMNGKIPYCSLAQCPYVSNGSSVSFPPSSSMPDQMFSNRRHSICM